MCDTLCTGCSGIPIVEAIGNALASSNELIRQTQRSILLITQGQELNYSMGRDVFPKLVISMIKIGEETGQLSFMLES